MTNRQQWIQVSGDKSFLGEGWREAFLYYLNGVWADKAQVMYRPKLSFDSVALRLDQSTGTYYGLAKCLPPMLDPWEIPQFSPGEMPLEVGNDQMEVEGGLMRLVRNHRIKLLKIHLPEGGWIRLWKGTRRGELFIDFANLPSMEDMLRSSRDELSLNR